MQGLLETTKYSLEFGKFDPVLGDNPGGEEERPGTKT